ncbi:S8 family peptidase [uncultured Lamprocystis sp.]|uniref:S8 family peptidase n=1 Tax=uncultured Lamprocystis sp. TaxID=543132 RepID=UPI0025CEE350|nr:S8 family peptidase [uncultured Lamprocystis sp.]
MRSPLTRHFEGDGSTEAQAPEVRIINLSVGDPSRLFFHGLSPWARLLDWLSYKYGVLFIVSAGNHATALDLDIPKGADWSNADAETREAAILRTIKVNARHRRILSPAESINALTVGASHADACPQGPRKTYHCDPLLTRSMASPIGANGLGFLRALKPEILMPGGRQIYEEALGTGEPNMRLAPLQNYGPPGQKTAVPGSVPGELAKTLWFRGTSNATALATRLGARLFEMLGSLRAKPDAPALSPRYDTVLLKALLVHGAAWAEAGDRLRGIFKQEVGGRRIKEFIGRFLGYGLVDPERVLGCTERRATLLGFGTLTNGEAHAFALPLPRNLSGTSGLRRLTITLAWLTPIAAHQQRYRKAQLWFTTDASDLIGVARGPNGYDDALVRRGTVQHEVFEGEKARAFTDGDTLRIQVNCREDAAGLDEEIDYGLVVSFEVGEEVPVEVYEQVRQRLRTAVPITP